MINTPLSNKPKITREDILNGTVKRYFVRHVSTGKVTEIDKSQYTKFVGKPLYETVVIDWNIAGNANDTQAIDGTVLYGTAHRNTKLIEHYEKKMRGLSRLLRNPLEYFFGVFNTPISITEILESTPLVEITPPETPAADPTPPESVWTNIAYDSFTDTNGVTIQTHTPTSGFTGWLQPTSGGGNIQIQSNTARQISAPLGGRRHFVTTSDIANDEFKFFADIYPSSGGAEIGIMFRSDGSVTPSVLGGLMSGIELATTSVAGTGLDITARLAMRFWTSGSQGSDFWSNAAVPIPNYNPSGSRFEVTVNGSNVDISIMPPGGGTPYFTEQGITLPSPVFNDAGHQRFGFRYGSSAIARAYDNFTVQTLQ